MPSRIPLRALSLRCRSDFFGRRSSCLGFTRSVVTTTSSSIETLGIPSPSPPEIPSLPEIVVPLELTAAPVSAAQRERRIPRLRPFHAYKAEPSKLVKVYTDRLDRGHPMIVRNLPGFLDGQRWFDHAADPDGAFKAPRVASGNPSELGFGLLKEILMSALAGRAPGSVDPVPEAQSRPGVLFDHFKARCRLTRRALDGSRPPLRLFRDWLCRSEFSGHSFDRLVDEVRDTHRAQPLPLVPFEAPLAFFRAVHQYNRAQQIPRAVFRSQADMAQHEARHGRTWIDGLRGQVVLKGALTEEFPFPRIVRDIGQSTYQPESCHIRVGVRPRRGAMRRYRLSASVVGQLAGYSIVTMVPPRVKLLGGRPLEFYRRVPQSLWARDTTQFPLGASRLSIPHGAWTAAFEAELAAAGDILLATLVPGDGLLVPDGWWYGVRSINAGLQLHATVTWLLDRRRIGAAADRRPEHEDQTEWRRAFAPRVDI
ncbi:hypothetical protein SAMD00023353_12600050 [Rosellinia necatrix]|uniref:JmjC domain-containing protein n=1 Tax=Rosellinia necatrix TaxID=77044 RepID=A0A1W2TXG2_ROSNE|nr:hypothetical protein SAMD00023353_12600050 [Rosellinia necatrix]